MPIGAATQTRFGARDGSTAGLCAWVATWCTLLQHAAQWWSEQGTECTFKPNISKKSLELMANSRAVIFSTRLTGSLAPIPRSSL